MSSIDEEFRKELDEWDIIKEECILFEQDEVGDTFQSLSGGRTATVKGPDGKPVKVYIPEIARKKEQTAVGVGTVVKVCSEVQDPHPRLASVQVGDKIKFPAGTQINAEFRSRERIQIIHLDNVLMVKKNAQAE